MKSYEERRAEQRLELIQLCQQIKDEMVKQGREHLILRHATTNPYISAADISTDMFNDYDLHSETTMIYFDETAGDFLRLQIDGIFIDNDALKFYVTVRADEERQTLVMNTEELCVADDTVFARPEDCCFILVPECEYDPCYVLKVYYSILTKQDGYEDMYVKTANKSIHHYNN